MPPALDSPGFYCARGAVSAMRILFAVICLGPHMAMSHHILPKNRKIEFIEINDD